MAAVMVYVSQTGNPHQSGTESTEHATPVWGPPPGRIGPVDPPLPSGFPSLSFPPPMPRTVKNNPQPVPTRYGLTYAVPSTREWLASNEAVLGHLDESGQATIATYGAVSRYGAGYCPEVDTSTLAYVGVTGRNGISVESAARQEIDKARALYSDPEFGAPPTVRVGSAIAFDIDGRPAVRYTASVSGIPTRAACETTEAQFDVIATPGYATAEVAVFVVERRLDRTGALTPEAVETIVRSIRRSE
ncbi:hypothetical protein ACWIGW_05040 [Nocardia brasiliensis]